eukprot:6205880-Pleurochrysis_carterae.AAC.2
MAVITLEPFSECIAQFHGRGARIGNLQHLAPLGRWMFRQASVEIVQMVEGRERWPVEESDNAVHVQNRVGTRKLELRANRVGRRANHVPFLLARSNIL